MRILIVSYFFPPFNTMGAVRVGKMAKFLYRMGHELKVISASNQPLQPTLPLEIPEDSVYYTRCLNVNAIPEILLGGRRRVAAEGFVPKGRSRNLLRELGRLYKTVTNFPDGQIGWYPFAVQAALCLLATWKPDLIYASAMPYTSLLAARRLSKKFGIPWVAELRDLWVDHHFYQYPGWRKKIEDILEHRICQSAAGIVTVSEPLAEILRAKYQVPVRVILNGFDPEDYPETMVDRSNDQFLRIVYTGMIYEGKQDPSPLFAALKLLGPEAKKVRIEFYGRYLEPARLLAKRYGVEQQVVVHPTVPYRESMARQKAADVLLLLLWNDPRGKGLFSGKLFEYLGAGRPVLAIGPDDNVAAALIRERLAGVVAGEPEEIASVLRRWIAIREHGPIPPIDTSMVRDFTREEQARRLMEFLHEVIKEVH